MIGVPGTAQRLFGALREEGISVILISQGSSEHSICCAIPQEQARAGGGRRAPRLRARARRTARSRTSTSIPDLQRSSPSSATAWRARRASRRRCSTRSARAGVNVRAIAQGASERNISVGDRRRAARRARCARCTPASTCRRTRISIGVIGPGTVGGVLLDQLASQTRAAARAVPARPARARHHRLASACCCPITADPLAAGARRSKARRRPPTSTRFVEHVRRRPPAAHGAHRLHRERRGGASTIRDWLGGRHPRRDAEQEGEQRGRSRSTGTLQRGAPRTAASHYLYEATVGAGLPVVQTLRDLRETGDEIRASRASSPARSPTCSTSTTAAQPFSEHRARRAAARLHRAGSARRPLGHGRGAQAHHPRPRDGPAARARGRQGREPGAGRPRRGLDRGIHGAAAAATTPPCAERLEAARARGKVLRYVGAARRPTGEATVGLVELDTRTRSPTSP